MKVIRTFHPIGQGAFYTERFFFYDGDILKAEHNIVFDCGNLWKTKRGQKVVSKAFDKTDVIDFLFISHLDYDHISLVETIFQDVGCTVKNIVLPLISVDDLWALYAYYLILGAQSGAEFVYRIIEAIAPSTNRNIDNRDDGIIVHMVGDTGEEYDGIGIGKARRWANGSEQNATWEPDWVLIPYNVEYKSRQKELIRQFDLLVANKDVADVINSTAGEEIISGQELFEKLKDESFVEKVLRSASMRSVIKEAYEKIKGGTNENSLLLYSGPIKKENDYCIVDCVPYCSWCHCGTDRAGCLYTGDSTCDLLDWNQYFSAIWGFIGTIQLPHHGSLDSFDVMKNKIGGRYIFPVSFGCTNMYGHPSGKVLSYLLANGCCTPMITEMANSVYMQKIERRRLFMRR